MRLFKGTKEKYEGISLKTTILIFAGLAVIAKLWELMKKHSYLLDELIFLLNRFTFWDFASFMVICIAFLLLIFIAIVEYRRKKIIEKYGFYEPIAKLEIIVAIIIYPAVLIAEHIHTEKRKKLIAKLEAWDKRVEEYKKSLEDSGGELYEQG